MATAPDFFIALALTTKMLPTAHCGVGLTQNITAMLSMENE